MSQLYQCEITVVDEEGLGGVDPVDVADDMDGVLKGRAV